jgi:hypothetical protein
MPGEYRPRVFPLMNPEACAAILRRLVSAWDGDDLDALEAALVEGRQLLGLTTKTILRALDVHDDAGTATPHGQE